MRVLIFCLFLAFAVISGNAHGKSLIQTVAGIRMSANVVTDTLRSPGVICYDSMIIVYGHEVKSGIGRLEFRVYDLGLNMIANKQYTSLPNDNCVSILRAGKYWWVLFASDPVITPVPVYAGSAYPVGQPQVAYFTNMYKPIPGQINGIMVLDSAFNRIDQRLITDQFTLAVFNEALNLNSDLGTSNYPVFTGNELLWNAGKEINCAKIEDASSGKFSSRWNYTASGNLSTMDLLGVVDSVVYSMYSTANPVQVFLEGLSLKTGSRISQRNLSDTAGTFFPSRIVPHGNGFVMAGGYVNRLVGPYPFSYKETSTGETRYFGRIDGTFVAYCNLSGDRMKTQKNPLPVELREDAADKFTIKACRFALCSELNIGDSGISAVFEIVMTEPPYEAKQFNRAAPKRMEQFYLPHSFVAGLLSFQCDSLFSETKSAFSVWDAAVPFEINRGYWDYFSVVYPGEQSSCFRSIRNNPHKANEPQPELYPGLLWPEDGDAKYYYTHARQAFPGYDNSPFDIQALYANDSVIIFNFTVQDTLDQASSFTPPFSFKYSVRNGSGLITSTGSRKVIKRLNANEAIVFSANDDDRIYSLRKEKI